LHVDDIAGRNYHASLYTIRLGGNDFSVALQP
jgi:hypothetical protein